MNTRNTFLAILVLGCATPAFAQSGSGKGSIDGDYGQDVRRYISQLPFCPSPNPTPPEGANPDPVAPVTDNGDLPDVRPRPTPMDFINKIAFVLKESMDEGETEEWTRPRLAYLKPRAALEAITIATEYCQDLHSILSRPIAEATLKITRGLEHDIDDSDRDSKSKELYDFAMASASVAFRAATTLDQDFFGPYSRQWDPVCGFYCGDRPSPFRTPRPFAQKLFDIAADTLGLLDTFGISGLTQPAYFHVNFGETNAYLPAAQGIVTFVLEDLKRNYAIFCKEREYLDLEILKAFVDSAVSQGNSSDILVRIEKTHEDSDSIARRLRSWWSDGR